MLIKINKISFIVIVKLYIYFLKENLLDITIFLNNFVQMVICKPLDGSWLDQIAL